MAMGAMQSLTTPLSIAQDWYYLFSNGEMEIIVEDYLAPDVVWTEPASLPHGGEHQGPKRVATGVFGRIPEIWGDLEIIPEQWIEAGDDVVVRGRYVGSRAGRAYDVPFCHVMTIEEGRIRAFHSYMDTAATLDLA